MLSRPCGRALVVEVMDIGIEQYRNILSCREAVIQEQFFFYPAI